MAMWEPFSEAGRRMIVVAQEVAEQYHNNYIGEEHIFIGIMRAGDSPAAEALAFFGITQARIEEAATPVLQHGAGNVTQEMTFTPGGKQLIEGAFAQARSLQHHYIGAEHLLLAYLDRFAPKSQVWRALDVDAGPVREKLLAMLAERPAPQPQPRQHETAQHQNVADAVFARIGMLDRQGKESAVEAESNRLLYYIDTDDLWKRLQAVSGRHDIVGTLLYAFIIAHRDGRSADETLREVLSRLEQNYNR